MARPKSGRDHLQCFGKLLAEARPLSLERTEHRLAGDIRHAEGEQPPPEGARNGEDENEDEDRPDERRNNQQLRLDPNPRDLERLPESRPRVLPHGRLADGHGRGCRAAVALQLGDRDELRDSPGEPCPSGLQQAGGKESDRHCEQECEDDHRGRREKDPRADGRMPRLFRAPSREPRRAIGGRRLAERQHADFDVDGDVRAEERPVADQILVRENTAELGEQWRERLRFRLHILAVSGCCERLQRLR